LVFVFVGVGVFASPLVGTGCIGSTFVFGVAGAV
jgi:hypothetical protein